MKFHARHDSITVTLSWCVQNYIVISWPCIKPEHCKFLLNSIEIPLTGWASGPITEYKMEKDNDSPLKHDTFEFLLGCKDWHLFLLGFLYSDENDLWRNKDHAVLPHQINLYGNPEVGEVLLIWAGGFTDNIPDYI